MEDGGKGEGAKVHFVAVWTRWWGGWFVHFCTYGLERKT